MKPLTFAEAAALGRQARDIYVENTERNRLGALLNFAMAQRGPTNGALTPSPRK